MSPRQRAISFVFLVVSFVCAQPSWVAAQTCGSCDHTIDAKTTYVDASKLAKPILPGQTICFRAGKKQFLRLINFKGSASKYLTFLNCGGQVLIENSPRGFGFAIGSSQYFKLTGTGTKGVKYGFKINGTPKGASGLTIGDKSSHFEVEYMEIMRTGFAGITAKTDPNCSQRDLRSFVMRDIHFHHNYIHQTGGEGFYIGYFAYPTRTVKCDGKDTTLYPHRIEGVSIHHNILDKNGWDAIQLGSAPKDASIHHNVVTNYATAKETYQQSGIQLNAGAAADVYNNILLKGSGQGIAVFGYGGNKIYNNLIVEAGADGIYVNDKTAQTTRPYVIANNTIVKPARYGIGLSVAKLKNNPITNNLVVEPGDFGKSGDKSYIAFITSASFYKLAGNLKVRRLSQASFVAPGKDNYRLKQGASAIDKGVSVAGHGITKDLDDNPRAVGPTDVGAYEFRAAPPGCKDGEQQDCNGGKGSQRCQAGVWGPCVPKSGKEPGPTEPAAEKSNSEPPQEADAPDAAAQDTASPQDASPPEPRSSPDSGSTKDSDTPKDSSSSKDSGGSSEPTSPSPDAPGSSDAPGGEKSPAPGACGCQASKPPAAFWLLAFLVLLGVTRRQASSSQGSV